MWNEMSARVRDLVEHFQRQALVAKLNLLSDHLLEDMGLRRDQLDLLRLPPAQAPASTIGYAPPRAAARPSLQGCG